MNAPANRRRASVRFVGTMLVAAVAATFILLLM